MHQDSLGSSTVSTGSTGTSLSTTKYLPFGATRSSTGSLGTDRKFTGQRLDGTGLYFYNARYYDPEIGRFISPDPVVYARSSPAPESIYGLTVSFNGPWVKPHFLDQTAVPAFVDPQMLNRYSYVLNNPLKYADPSGNFLDTLFDIFAVGWDLYDLIVNPSLANAGVLGFDVAATFIPFLPAGAGITKRAVKTSLSVAKKEVTVRKRTIAKSESTKWKEFKNFREKTKTNGKSGKDKRFYEWDYGEGHIEVYDSNGKHMGEMDPVTGTIDTSKRVDGRTIDIK